MKKRIGKIGTVFALSAVLSLSGMISAVASEADTAYRTADIPEELKSEAEAEETNVETLFYIREKDKDSEEEEEIVVRRISLDDLEKEVEEGLKPEIAAVVFQEKEENEEKETEESEEDDTEEETEEKEEETEEETEDFVSGLVEEENWEEEQEEKEEEEQEQEEEEEEKIELAMIELLDEQIETVYETADLVHQTVVLLNNCDLEDKLIFTDCEQVKAVTNVSAQDEEELIEIIENYDLEEEYAAYLAMQNPEEEESEDFIVVSRILTPTGLRLETEENTESSTENDTTEKRTASDDDSSTDTDTNSETETDSTDTDADSVDVIITLIPDEVWEGDDTLTATYDILSYTEVTSGKVTITYDPTVMTYDEADVDSCDALEDMMVNVSSPDDSDVGEGQIEISFYSSTGIILEGSMVDLYFDLVDEAEIGDEYTITLTVDEMKNGTTDLTSQVKTETIVAVSDDVEPEEEEDPETTSSTTSVTEETQSTEVSAPKTGDESNIARFVAELLCAMAVLVILYKKARKRAE